MTTSGANSGYLGIDTKSIHSAEVKRARYTMRRSIQRMTYAPAEGANGQHRVCACGRGVRDGQAGISILRRAGGGGARYRGLTACGDVWACPVCAAKISEVRRRELQKAIVVANLRGSHAYLLTLTLPHEFGVDLGALMGPFAKALQRLKNSRGYKAFMERHGRLGQIKALEVKHGPNGWHPHVHELVIAAPGLLEDTRGLDDLRAAWVASLLKSGIGDTSKVSDMLAHALDLRGGDDAAAYVAKYGHEERWGMASEMTQWMKKTGGVRGDHFTPFELAAMGAAGDAHARRLFAEYLEAFKGRRAMTWTRGLRARLLDDEELTDEQAAALDDPMPDEEHVGHIDLDRYQEIVARKREGDLLYHVSIWTGPMGQADLDELIDGWIDAGPRLSSGAMFTVGHGLRRLIEVAVAHHA